MKDMGNGEYKDGDFVQAVASYTKIIKTRHYNSIIYNNRALAFLKLKKWAEAEVDGHRAVVLKPSWCKGYYCFVQAMEAQECIHDAHSIADYGVSRCSNENCNHWAILKDTVMRLTRKCKSCPSRPVDSKKLSKKMNSAAGGNNRHVGKHSLHDVPDLVSDSESDIEMEKLPSLESLLEMLTEEWKNGTEALLKNNFLQSIQHFNNSFNFVSSLKQQNYKIEEVEIVLLNYSLAVAHLEIGGIEEIKKSVSLLEEIINMHKDVRLPCAYYKLGSAFYKMNKFEEALIPLTNGLSIIEKGILFSILTWLGTDIQIQETRGETLKKLLEELIEKCRYPPSPDAICRHETCSLAKNIFYSDPDFKGFCRVSCSENCHLEYHPHCWKLVREKHTKREKDFLGQTCLTPDCRSTVFEIEIIDKDGLSKKFECDSNTTKQKEKQRKTKLEKKLELKEKKKQKKREEKNVKVQGSLENEEEEETDELKSNMDVNGDVTTHHEREEKTENVEVHENVAAPQPEKENISPNQISTKLYEDNAEPLYVIRREADNVHSQSADPRQARAKKKAKRKNVMSAEEFCGDRLCESQYYNEYLNRVKKLQLNKELAENVDDSGDENWASLCENYQGMIPELDPQRPFYVPEDLRNNLETLESILQSYGRVKEESNNLKEIRENIYSYMEGFLEEQGPIAKDSPALQHEVETFPTEAQELISKSGGLVDFLLESFHFAEVKNFICVMKDVGKAYSTPGLGEKYGGAYSLDDFDDYEIPEKKTKDNSTMDSIVKKCSELVANKNEDVEMPSNLSKDAQLNSSYDDDCDDEIDRPTSSCNFSSSTIRKLNNTIKHGTAASQFQLQVLVRSLSEAQQSALLISSLNSLTENECSLERLQSINKKVKGIELQLPVRTHHKRSQTDKVVVSGKEVDTDVYVKLQSLQDENARFQDRITDAEDAVVRLQKQHAVKVKAMEKELRDVQEELDGEKTTKTAYEMERETERKRILQQLKQAKQEQQNAQSILEKLTKQVEHLTSVIQEQTKEREKLSSALEKEKQSTSNLQDTLNCMLESSEDAGQQTNKAEKGFLEMKEMCGIMRIDEAAAKCVDLLNKMEEDKRRYGSSPLVNAALTQPTEDGRKYLQDLDSMKKEFLKSCRDETETLESGGTATLERELPAVPELPTSLKSILSSGSNNFGGPVFPQMGPNHQAMFNPQGMPRFQGPFHPGMMFGPRYPPPPMMGNFGPPGLGMNRPNMINPPQVTNEFKSPPVIFQKDEERQMMPNSLSLDLPLLAKTDKVDEKLEKPKQQDIPTKPIIPVTAPVKPLPVTTAKPTPPVPAAAKLYDGLTPIPITAYDSLCDIAVEVKEPAPETSGTGTLLGAISKVPVAPTAVTKIVFSSPQSSKNRQSSYEKLISKLHMRFPSIEPERFDAYITIFRAKNNNKLSGLSMDQIVDGVASVIESTQSSKPQVHVNSKIVTNHLANGNGQKHGPAWDQVHSKKASWKSETETGELSCCICFEDMSPKSIFKVECGHSFHSTCVKEWLKKDSTCPLCRVYILLPDEFPSLG